MRLMRYKVPLDEFNERFVARLRALLSHPDPNVRHDALLFVGANSNRAPMWRFTFDETLLDLVLESTRSPSAQERSDAAYALTDIRQLDLDRSREAFLRLATDTSADVRWRVGFGLSEQLDREDVQAVIAALLRDDDPGVRYMTILAVGPEKHVQELQELARCANRQIAGWAAEKLDQLAQSQASTNAPVTRSVP
jgi:HEAT repeat protein